LNAPDFDPATVYCWYAHLSPLLSCFGWDTFEIQ